MVSSFSLLNSTLIDCKFGNSEVVTAEGWTYGGVVISKSGCGY